MNREKNKIGAGTVLEPAPLPGDEQRGKRPHLGIRPGSGPVPRIQSVLRGEHPPRPAVHRV